MHSYNTGESMPNFQYILVRYGEIGLKGKNRPAFEKRLISNIKRSLGDLGRTKIFKLRGRLMLETGEAGAAEVMDLSLIHI